MDRARVILVGRDSRSPLGVESTMAPSLREHDHAANILPSIASARRHVEECWFRKGGVQIQNWPLFVGQSLRSPGEGSIRK